MTTPPLAQERCIMPAPHEPQAHVMRHNRWGDSHAIYTYCDQAGALLGYILRYDTSEVKQILPLTYWQMKRITGDCAKQSSRG